MNPRDLLAGSFQAALLAADPRAIVPEHLPAPPSGRALVVGAGKAAAAMAAAIESHWPAGCALEGLVITRYAHGVPTNRLRVIEAGHPVPDEAGEAAAREILARASALGEEDLLLVLVSGGGSSLLSLPAEGIAIGDLKTVTRDLLACGAPIQEINTIRKHTSAIQGGRLALATRARVLALVISDVTGDDPTHIASGPCSPDPTTFGDAMDILARYGVKAPDPIQKHLAMGQAGRIPETPKPGDQGFNRVETRVIATAHTSLMAAAAFVQNRGITPMVLGDAITGESREIAKMHAAIARQIRLHAHPFKPPVAVITGGETTVTVRGDGKGGRCSEFLLSLAIELGGLEHVWALAADTDGIDGAESNAGAIAAPDTLERAAALGLNARQMLDNNDAYGFFRGLGDLVSTGPTRTNVNDYRIVLVQ